MVSRLYKDEIIEGYRVVVLGVDPSLPHINGYVAIPSAHPCYETDYSESCFEELEKVNDRIGRL